MPWCSDYKYDIQMLAEEIAAMDYTCDYYDLPEPVRDTVYRKAETAYAEIRAQAADND